MLSINRIFWLEWEFLKSTGWFFVPDNCFVLDSGGFSAWLMLVTCGNGWFLFWYVYDEWIWFDWSVVEECEIWFSVWDWQDSNLGCFMNCKISIPNVFAEKILHLRHLKNGSALLALMHLFILVISFLFIPEHCGCTHCHIWLIFVTYRWNFITLFYMTFVTKVHNYLNLPIATNLCLHLWYRFLLIYFYLVFILGLTY